MVCAVGFAVKKRLEIGLGFAFVGGGITSFCPFVPIVSIAQDVLYDLASRGLGCRMGVGYRFTCVKMGFSVVGDTLSFIGDTVALIRRAGIVIHTIFDRGRKSITSPADVPVARMRRGKMSDPTPCAEAGLHST